MTTDVMTERTSPEEHATRISQGRIVMAGENEGRLTSGLVLARESRIHSSSSGVVVNSTATRYIAMHGNKRTPIGTKWMESGIVC
jgi:hypothetical protein